MPELLLTDFGAVSDARELRDVVMVMGTSVVTSLSASFVTEDVGKPIVIADAGAAGAKLRTTISSVVSSTEILVADAAETTAEAVAAVYGTDCSAALDSALGAVASALGGTLIVDGYFLLAAPVERLFGTEDIGIELNIIGFGTNSAIWIGTEATADAISINAGFIEWRDLNFIGVPGPAVTDARRVLSFNGATVSFERCGFHGLLAGEAVIYASSSILNTHRCMFGGSFVAGGTGGYVHSVIENKDWAGYRDEYSQFIDYGYFMENFYSKSGNANNLGWIRADSPVGTAGARGESVFSLRGTRLDEGALFGIVVKPTTGRVRHVHLSGVRQNVIPAENGRGVQCQNVDTVVMERCWQGWSPTPALIGHFQDCGTVLIDALKLSAGVSMLSATNVTSLTLKDTVGVTSFNFKNVNFHPVTSRYGGLSMIKDGAIADSDFVAPPAVGTLAFDRTANRLYLKRVTSEGWIYFDMSGGNTMGPELVVNGTFDTDTSGWTAAFGCTLSIVSGALRVTNGAVYGRAYQAVPTVIGQRYRVSVDIIGGNAGRLVRVGTSQGDLQFAQFYTNGGTANFTATTALTYIALMLDSETVGKYADFDNVSLKAI